MKVAEGDEVVVHRRDLRRHRPRGAHRLAGLDQHHCRVTCEGEDDLRIIEPYDTLCYDVSQAGVMGFSLLDPPS